MPTDTRPPSRSTGRHVSPAAPAVGAGEMILTLAVLLVLIVLTLTALDAFLGDAAAALAA